MIPSDRRRGHRASAGALVGVLLCAATAASAPTPVAISGNPIGPPLAMDGQGLCTASAVSMNPVNDFAVLNTGTFDSGINGFIEAHAADRVQSTLRNVFDLSNNNITALMVSYGDFTNSMVPGCKVGGCDFFINDNTTPFATRFRGFFNVTDKLAGKPLHIGFFTDDGVSLTIFDSRQAHSVIVRPAQFGVPTWRSTNQVTFATAGIYPIEINYVQVADDAALEMSILTGPFSDFEQSAKQDPQNMNDLKNAGFAILPATAFFQTVNGQPAFADLGHCEQCDRRFAGALKNNGCQAGYYCNEAALCAPCDSSLFCGDSCSPCGLAQPFCLNVNGKYTCVPCRDDNDCTGGKHCDMRTHQCQDCNVDVDCTRGKVCNAHACVPCATPDACAGVSCNCCPKGATGKPLQCAPLLGDDLPSCVECASDADCQGRKCDTMNGRCVDAVAPCNAPDRCGPQCVHCPTERPYCEGGLVCVQCRSDVECGAGTFCISGECAPCATDRHCGDRCGGCGGDTPFCLSSDGTSTHAACVRCLGDADCNGGSEAMAMAEQLGMVHRCLPSTHACDKGCAMSCAPGTFCNGARCVTCYGDSQCCGGTCDVASGTCTQSCKDSGACLGTEHCSEISQSCTPGRRKPKTDPQGGGFCSCIPSRLGGRAPAVPGGALALLLAGFALLTRRRSSARG